MFAGDGNTRIWIREVGADLVTNQVLFQGAAALLTRGYVISAWPG